MTTDNITRLHGGPAIPAPDGDPVHEVVNALRELLEAAEAGRIRAFAAGSVLSDGAVVTSLQFREAPEDAPESGLPHARLHYALSACCHQILAGLVGEDR
jgi:hypothetical protein